MNVRDKIKKIVESHELLRLATVDENGMPKVRSVDYAVDKEDESVLYFMTFKQTNKVNELRKNNNVHVVIDKEAGSIEGLAQILYFKASGKAYEVNTQEEVQKAMGLIIEKYPYLSDLPGDPSMMTVFRIELDKVVVTDNSVEFGYMEEETYR